MKKRLFLFVLINLIFLSSCNTKRPSAYLTTEDNKTTEGVIETTFYVYFETNGGTSVGRKEIKKGTLLSVPKTPTKEYADFNGWYIDKELTTPFDFGTLVYESMTLYASWNSYNKITFETNGGKAVEAQYVKGGYNVEYIPTTKEYADFNGWYIDKELTTPFDFGTLVYTDLILYANWIYYHKVIFQTVGGIVIAVQNVKDGFNATFFSAPKANYTFDNWYIDKECSIKFDFSQIITEDLILYARWV